MKREHSAGVIVYVKETDNGNPDILYLLLNYRKGHWDLAKGKLEDGETNLEAAIRELKEETNLEAEVYSGFEQSLTYFFKNHQGELVKKDVTFFVGKAHNKNVVLSPEHLFYKWVPLNEAIKLLTYANAQQLLKRADYFIRSLNN